MLCVLGFRFVSILNDARYRRDEKEIFNKDENEHSLRARWRKISFLKLS